MRICFIHHPCTFATGDRPQVLCRLGLWIMKSRISRRLYCAYLQMLICRSETPFGPFHVDSRHTPQSHLFRNLQYIILLSYSSAYVAFEMITLELLLSRWKLLCWWVEPDSGIESDTIV